MSGGLGRLVQVDLRAAWLGEATHFTPRLAQDENLPLLGEALRLDLPLPGQETRVGPFRADLPCRDMSDDPMAPAGTQPERTDHGHLGQLMTCAAGLHAATIVWIAAEATEAHRAAVDWLNEIAAARFRFFALEEGLRRIAEGPPAPRFNVVSRPNGWSRRIAAAQGAGGGVSPLSETCRRHRAALTEGATPGPVRPTQPLPQNSIDFAIGRTEFPPAATVSARERRARARRCIASDAAQARFGPLPVRRAGIDAAFDAPLDGQSLPDRRDCRICIDLADADVMDEDDWPRRHAKLRARLTRPHEVMAARVRDLPLAADLADASFGGEA